MGRYLASTCTESLSTLGRCGHDALKSSKDCQEIVDRYVLSPRESHKSAPREGTQVGVTGVGAERWEGVERDRGGEKGEGCVDGGAVGL